MDLVIPLNLKNKKDMVLHGHSAPHKVTQLMLLEAKGINKYGIYKKIY